MTLRHDLPTKIKQMRNHFIECVPFLLDFKWSAIHLTFHLLALWSLPLSHSFLLPLFIQHPLSVLRYPPLGKCFFFILAFYFPLFTFR